MIIAALEDAHLTSNDIYLAYFDFRNAFGLVDHSRLLVILEDLDYQDKAIELISNIYTKSTTSFFATHFGTTRLCN